MGKSKQVNINVLNRAGVLNDILANCGVDKNSTPEKRQREIDYVAQCSAPELFKRYMTWQGIIGYEYSIIKALRAIERATGTKLKASDY